MNRLTFKTHNMKKLFYPVFALATMAMTTSCSDELENGTVTNSNEATVSFNLQLENAVGSRAAGDGTIATELHYAVYKANADNAIGTEIPALRSEGKVTIEGQKATVQLTLVKGQTYNFLFWAQHPNGEDYYTIDFANGDIKVKYDDNKKDANDEKRDAFYKVQKNVKITGPIEETIVLKRPFAQVNIGTKIGSLADAKTAAVWIKQSDLTISDVATKLNAYSGAVSEQVEVKFDAAAIMEQNKYDKEGELKDVDQQNYEYLAMNYILVNDTQKDAETDKNGVEGDTKATVNATFNIWGSQISENGALDTTPINTFEIPNIPVQRNWRTNIIGDIMNETVTFNIVVDPKFDNDHNYYTEKELAYAFVSGGEITLDKDVELTKPLVLEGDKVVTINLNGKTIKAPTFAANSNADVTEGTTDSCPFIVKGGTLNIKGNGTIESAECDYSMAVWAIGSDAVVNIYDGVYKNAGEGSDLIYAKNGAKINIYGGTFIACEKQAGSNGTEEKYSALNLADNTGSEIKVYGGRFFEFNPADNKSENPKVNFVAPGYAVVKEVVDGEGTYYNVVSYNEVFDGSEDVTLLSDMVADGTIVLAAGQDLDGADKILTMEKSDAQYAIQFTDGTIKKLTIEGYNTRNNQAKVTRGIYIVKPQADVLIENVNISGVAYPLNTGTKSTQTGLKLTVKDSELIGWSSWDGGFESATFENCHFGIGNYFTKPEEVEQNWNGAIRPYVTTTFKNCTFDRNFFFMLDKLPEGVQIELINCRLANEDVTITDDFTLGKAVAIAEEDIKAGKVKITIE